MSFFVVSPVFPAGAFESQSPQTRMNTDFFTFRCTLPQKHMFNVDFGRGLIKCGSAIVPFMDNFPKNRLYKLMTTKLSETNAA